MDFKSIFLLILSIAWLFLCQRWYCCWMQEACINCTDEPRNTYPIGFTKGSALPDTTYQFGDLLNRLKQDRKSDQILEISGRYHSSTQKELGFERAKNTLKLLREVFQSDSIVLRSQQSLSSNIEKEAFSPMVDIQWIPIQKLKQPDKLIVQFPNAQATLTMTDKEKNELKLIANYAKRYGSTIVSAGHTDPSGAVDMNKKFSLLRAEKVAEYLKVLGIPANQIIVEGHGSSRQIDPLDIAKNRRVEVSILN